MANYKKTIFFSYFSQKTGIDSCQKMSKPVFWEKLEKYFKHHLLNFLPRMLSDKAPMLCEADTHLANLAPSEMYRNQEVLDCNVNNISSAL